jgi:hypothetical protein
MDAMNRQVPEREVREEAGEPDSRLPRKLYNSPQLTKHGSIAKETAFEPSGPAG